MSDKTELQTEVSATECLSSQQGELERLVMLRCPWCGGAEVSVEIRAVGSVPQFRAHAHCAECCAAPPDGSGVVDSAIEAKKLALNKWNDRAT